MQLILDIEASYKDTILNIIDNLKEGIVKNYTIASSSTIEPLSIEEEEEIKTTLEAMSLEEREISDVRQYSIEL